MADSLGTKAKAGMILDHGLYGAGPAIAYPEVPGATDIGAGNQIHFTSENLVKGADNEVDQSLLGAVAPQGSDRVAEPVSGSIQDHFHWITWERIIWAAMGFEHPQHSPATIVAGAYAHLFEPDNTLQDEAWRADEIGTYVPNANDRKVRRFQIGLAKQVNDHVFNSLMVNKLTISGDPRGLSIAADVFGNQRYRGAYNSGAWTLPSGPRGRVLFQDGTTKLGINSVAPSVAQKINSFEITIDNKLKGDDQTMESGLQAEIPVRDGVREVTLKVEYPRYSDDADALLFDVDTRMAASIEFLGPIITGATPYAWKFFFPCLRWVSNPGPNISGPSRLQRSYEFRAEKPVAQGQVDPFIAAGSYRSIPLVKDPEIVVMAENADANAYSTEV